MSVTVSARRDARFRENSARRAAKYGCRYEDVSLFDVAAQSGGVCWVCKSELHGNDYEADHILPLSKGAPHALYNLFLACPDCNQKKGAKLMAVPLTSTEKKAAVVAILARRRLRQLPVPIRASVGPVSAGPRSVTARLVPDRGFVRAALAAADEIRSALRDNAARIFLAGQYLVIEKALPAEDWQTVGTAGLTPTMHALPIGRGQDFLPVYHDLRKAPHLLVVGATNSGKSIALSSLAWAAARAGHDLVLIDTAAVTWRRWLDVAALALGVPTTAMDVAATLERTVELMRARPPEHGTPPDGWARRLVVVIDEVRGLDKRGLTALDTLMAEGRKYGVNVVLATQYAKGKLPRTVEDSATGRLALRVGDYHSSNNILGKSGAENLLGAGDALLKQADGSILRVQVMRVQDREIAALPRTAEPAAVVGQEPTPSMRADDTPVAQWAKAHGLTTGNAIYKRARAVGINGPGKGIGMHRAQRIARTLTT